MKLILRSLTIINFKGISELTLRFDEKENFILGQNGAGKTTISDAYHWLMTGKDSSDAKDFEIKPIVNGERVKRLENSVEAVIDVDGEEITLKKVHSEKWVKPKGQLELEFKGNETAYFYNGVPVTMKEYMLKLSQFIPEDKLKLFSNTGYFNSLKWNDRRAVLIDMAGNIDIDTIIRSNPEYAFIGEFLAQKKTFKEYKTQIAAERKKAKDALELIPSRIDEVQRANTGLQHPFERLKSERDKLSAELSQIETSISDKNEANKLQDEKMDALHKEKSKLANQAQDFADTIRATIKSNRNTPDSVKDSLVQKRAADDRLLTAAKDELAYLNTRVASGNAMIADGQKEIEKLEARIAGYREKWQDMNSKKVEYPDGFSCCPACKREFDPADIEAKKAEMVANLNQIKQSSLDTFVRESDELKAKVRQINAQIDEYTLAVQKLNDSVQEKAEEIKAIEARIAETDDALQAHVAVIKQPALSIDDELKSALAANQIYLDLQDKIKTIDAELSEFKPVDNIELITRRKEIHEAIEALNKDINNELLIKNNLSRIEELKEQEKVLSQQVADLEKKEFYMQQFTLRKMDEVESRVNGLFSYVSFKMFDTQINGEVVEDCKVLVDGKPIDGNAVNTASVFNAGVDIINTLSKHYNTYTPMFIDGRESVTELLPSESQVINLVVSPTHSKLTLKTANELAEAV